PFELLNEILKIEISVGRKRQEKQWIAREMDIDIIFYDNRIIYDECLIVPHPQLQKRKFVLVPLNDIAPRFIHPALGKNISTLLKECTDDSEVELIQAPSFDSIMPN
ncbi:MAG: 2-amino-4-hydroxy-6-hydroxymethyldihydropteridine diphosphokinase, partial [Bacteroidota bacterium]